MNFERVGHCTVPTSPLADGLNGIRAPVDSRAMREVVRSALVPYLPEQMFDLVVDVERYPEFLPWCVGAKLHDSSEKELSATLEMERAGRRERFTTRNYLMRPARMDLRLVDGPFNILEGSWTFSPIGGRGTRIGLEMRFEFSSVLAGLLFARSFEQSMSSLIDAFTRRARERYGSG